MKCCKKPHRLKRQNVDVVIGVVETHGRSETMALVADLEQVARRRIEYRGVVLEELDLDAVLTRRPTVALIDELAHTKRSREPTCEAVSGCRGVAAGRHQCHCHAQHPAFGKPYDLIERDMACPSRSGFRITFLGWPTRS